MSFTKKSDVKKHLSARFRNPVVNSPVDYAGISKGAQPSTDEVQAAFTKDFTADHKEPLAVVVPFPEAGDATTIPRSPSFKAVQL